jgi:hypothetical protein
MIQIGRCGQCKHRDRDSICNCPKLRENTGGKNRADELVYCYNEGGGFIVGKDFGCVHWEGKK